MRHLELQRQSRSAFLKEYPQRVLLLSDTLEKPTLDNLWNYLSHFYETLPPALREQFSFEDAAGIYTEGGSSRLFAICTQYQQVEGLKTLDCTVKGPSWLRKNRLTLCSSSGILLL